MFDHYKPFRNKLRTYNQTALLEAVWHYMSFLQFGRDLPPNLSHWLMGKQPKWKLGLLEWELDLLAKEAILNCPQLSGTTRITWSDTAALVNGIKGIENEVWRLNPTAVNDILFETTRIAHRQFHWQSGVTWPILVRYYKIYNNVRLSPLMTREFGMSPTEMFQIGMAIAGLFLSQYRIGLPVSNHLNNVTEDELEEFLNRFSKTKDKLYSLVRQNQSYDINWAYNFNPMRLFGPHVEEIILRRVRSALEENDLPVAMIERHPYTVCSVEDLEMALQVMAHTSIDSIMAHKTDATHRRWSLSGFLTNHRNAEMRQHVKMLFTADFERLRRRPPVNS